MMRGENIQTADIVAGCACSIILAYNVFAACVCDGAKAVKLDISPHITLSQTQANLNLGHKVLLNKAWAPVG